MNGEWGRPLSASLRRRIRRRVRRILVPVVHPAEERWRRAAFGGHTCSPFTVYLGAERS